MPDVERFPFVAGTNARGESTLRPQIPLRLIYRDQSLNVAGLLDSGADVNVLPYSLGLSLGAIWSEQTTVLTLSGNMANYEARGVIIAAQVGRFVPVQLVFAWTQTDAVP